MDAIAPGAFSSPWDNDALVDRLKAGWQHYSSSQLAALLSDEFGIVLTRNQVIGKIHRLGLTGDQKLQRVTRPKRNGKPREHRPRTRIVSCGPGGFRMMRVVETDMEPLLDVEVVPLKVTLLDRRDDQCHFPSVYEGEWLYCGHPTAPGKPYCAGHAQLCYVPQDQRKRSTRPAWR